MEKLEFHDTLVAPTPTEEQEQAVGGLAVAHIVNIECPGGKRLGDADCCSQPANCQRSYFTGELESIPDIGSGDYKVKEGEAFPLDELGTEQQPSS